MLSRVVLATVGVALPAAVAAASGSTNVDGTSNTTSAGVGEEYYLGGSFQMHQYKLTEYSDARTLYGKVASYYVAKNPSPADKPIWVFAIPSCTSCDLLTSPDCTDACGTDGQWCSGRTQMTVTMTDDDLPGAPGGFVYWMYKTKGAHVAMATCENADGYYGDAEYKGYHMRGAATIKAAFQDLVKKHGLGEEEQMLVVTGFSSGAGAAMHHTELVDQYVPSVSSKLHVVGVYDSLIPTQPCMHVSSSEKAACESILEIPGSGYDQNVIALATAITKLYSPSYAGERCATTYSSDLKRCMWGEYFLPTMTKPFMVYAQTNDKYLTNIIMKHNVTIASNRCTEGICSQLELLGSFTNQTLQAIPMRKPGNGLYVASCYAHALAKSKNFFTTKVAGTTMVDAVEEYLWRGGSDWSEGPAKNKDAAFLQWSDACTGFSCSPGCPSDCGGACGENGATLRKSAQLSLHADIALLPPLMRS